MRTVFVSSTFKDMQAERDAIRDKVASMVEAEARKHGDHIEFCDLRWGIDTSKLDSEESSRKVLDVCLTEIDRSQPPMIVILGDRYGWIPEEDLIRRTAEMHGMQIDDARVSATALEIEYGSMFLGRNTLFYIRHIVPDRNDIDIPEVYLHEDEEHLRLLENLKVRLSALPNSKTSIYDVRLKNGSPVEEDIALFAEMVSSDLKEIMSPEWEKFDNMSPFQREMDTQWNFVKEKAQLFTARHWDMEVLMELINGNEQVTVCTGEAGSGKSTLFGYIATDAKKRGWDVLPFAGGLTSNCNDAIDILKNTVYYLEEKVGETHCMEFGVAYDKKNTISPKELQERLKFLADKMNDGERLLVMVDALDQLFPDEYREELVFYPQGISDSVRFLITTLTNTKTPVQHSYFLEPLTDNDKREVIRSQMSRFGRELSDEVVTQILTLPASKNPFYVSLLVQWLRMMNAEDFQQINSSSERAIQAITNYQIQMISKCPTDLAQMCVFLFTEVGKRVDKHIADSVSELICATRYGLRQSDLAGIMGEAWNQLAFSHYINYLAESFYIRNDGRIDVNHRCIREGFQANKEKQTALHKTIADWLETLDDHDPVRMQELPVHRILADDRDGFIRYIDQHELGDNCDTVIVKKTAESIREVCLQYGVEWILDQIPYFGSYGYKWISVFWMLVSDLPKVFGNTASEQWILFSLVNMSKKALEPLLQKTSESNRQIFNKEMGKTIYESGEGVLFRNDAFLGAMLNMETIRVMRGFNKEGSLSKEEIESLTMPQRYELYEAYYYVAYAAKEKDGRENLEYGLRLTRDGVELLKSGLEEWMIEHGITQLQLYGCIGEMYSTLGENEKALEAYLLDLNIRNMDYEQHKLPHLQLMLAGGYVNVMNVLVKLQSWPMEVLEYAKKAVMTMEEALSKVTGKIEGEELICQIYLNSWQAFGKNAGKISSLDDYTVDEAVRWLFMAIKTARKDYWEKHGIKELIMLFTVMGELKQIAFRKSSNLSKLYFDEFQQWLREDETSMLELNDRVSSQIYLLTVDKVTDVISRSRVPEGYSIGVND